MQIAAQFDWLIQTKLQPPLPRGDVLPRPRLLTALCHGLLAHRLTLLSVPAGYGKTTLLCEWIHLVGSREYGVRGDSPTPYSLPHPFPGSRWTKGTTTRRSSWPTWSPRCGA